MFIEDKVIPLLGPILIKYTKIHAKIHNKYLLYMQQKDQKKKKNPTNIVGKQLNKLWQSHPIKYHTAMMFMKNTSLREKMHPGKQKQQETNLDTQYQPNYVKAYINMQYIGVQKKRKGITSKFNNSNYRFFSSTFSVFSKSCMSSL